MLSSAVEPPHESLIRDVVEHVFDLFTHELEDRLTEHVFDLYRSNWRTG
jgi:hypothetical protein